jgi:hypothetical protein
LVIVGCTCGADWWRGYGVIRAGYDAGKTGTGAGNVGNVVLGCTRVFVYWGWEKRGVGMARISGRQGGGFGE